MWWLWSTILKYSVQYVLTGKTGITSTIKAIGKVFSFVKVSYSSTTYKVLSKVFSIFGGIHWEGLQALFNGGLYYKLTEEDHDTIRAMLKPNYYFILTRRRCHLTTYLISLASFIATGKRSHYAHALMNVDNGNIKDDNDFKLIEATATGVHFSTFMQVFDCDSVALLAPRHVSDEDWTKAIDKAFMDLGKPYDNLFDILDDSRLSCIEFCRDVAKTFPDYDTKFANFEKMINEHGHKLTPQMLYDCSDFEIKFEVRR